MAPAVRPDRAAAGAMAGRPRVGVWAPIRAAEDLRDPP